MKNGEGSIQTAVIQYMAMRHDVAWVTVITVGIFRALSGKGRYRIGYLHQYPEPENNETIVDVIGQMRDGRLIAIEVKKPKERPSDAQYQFMYSVAMNNGVAFWVDRVEQVPRFMAEYYG